jgi:hypothetical protein
MNTGVNAPSPTYLPVPVDVDFDGAYTYCIFLFSVAILYNCILLIMHCTINNPAMGGQQRLTIVCLARGMTRFKACLHGQERVLNEGGGACPP